MQLKNVVTADLLQHRHFLSLIFACKLMLKFYFQGEYLMIRLQNFKIIDFFLKIGDKYVIFWAIKFGVLAMSCIKGTFFFV